jgi:hypothetical protein
LVLLPVDLGDAGLAEIVTAEQLLEGIAGLHGLQLWWTILVQI